MTEELRETLKQMAAPVLPSGRRMKKLYEGWDAYFERMNIPAEQQVEEFDGIMRARVLAGSISLVAPPPDTNEEE